MSQIDDCKADWKLCEGLRLSLYDDATAMAIMPGTTVKGHPSIGYGRALDVSGVTMAEADYLCGNDMLRIIGWATNNLHWFNNLDPCRQRAIVNMIGNTGFSGFALFKNFIAFMNARCYPQAAGELMNSAAARGNPKRYGWLAKIILNGEMPEKGPYE